MTAVSNSCTGIFKSYRDFFYKIVAHIQPKYPFSFSRACIKTEFKAETPLPFSIRNFPNTRDFLITVSKFYILVDGGYGPYIPQGPCNETCGEDGYQIQMRNCDSPPPDPMGMDCSNGMINQRTVNCSRIDCGSGKFFSLILWTFSDLCYIC